MRDVKPAPTSVVVTRVLALLVTIGPAVWGTWIFMEGMYHRRHPQRSEGTWPDFSPYLEIISGWLVLGVAACMASATIGIWRRKSGAAAGLVALCILALALIATYTAVAAHFNNGRHVPLSSQWRAYIVLLLVCTIFSTKAAFDLRGLSSERSGFRVGPPPLPPRMPDFNVIDDLPKDDA
jgi:hypothetical protein